MPENRKKSRSRRAHRPEDASPSSPLVTANGMPLNEDPTDEAPDPVEHAGGDADLAEAQVAQGRSDPGEVPDEDELVAYEEEDARAHPAGAGNGNGHGGGGRAGGSRALAASPEPHHPVRVSGATRLVDFMRGSWRELQRVQWPDRRQVFQATGVVLGFVVVAGAFLGLADLVAAHIVKFILK